jgi:tRNA pseudouridine13 synthase
VSSWPLTTADLPGTGGRLRDEASHFRVEEILLYEPEGEGDHVYVELVREGFTTRALVGSLARLFGIREVDVGYAGLKDRHARVTQTFSLLLPSAAEEDVRRRIEEELPVRVLRVRRHRNKLRPGHLLGNRFRVLLTGTVPDAPERARRKLERLEASGVANFYGEQRFGIRGDNPAKGRELLRRGAGRKGWLRRFLLSAYQAHLFNRYLAERMARGWLDRALVGDVAKKRSTGGLFLVEDAREVQERLARREVGITGPIYGARMMWAQGEPGELERRILEEEDLDPGSLERARLHGSRRFLTVFPEEVTLEPARESLWVAFRLPKGSFATVLLREIMEPAG